MTLYRIVSIDPVTIDGEVSEDKRIIEFFERREDAEKVLASLESVNILFHCYKIEACGSD